MNLYFIRHGETDWNNLGLIQGTTDNKLNDLGKSQARDIAPKLKNISNPKLISSPLTRAVQTMNIIKKENSWSDITQLSDNFLERTFGEFEGKDANFYLNTKDFSNLNLFEQDKDLEKRVREGINQITQENNENTLITCHSHTIKATLVSLFQNHYNYSYKLKNCAIIHIKYDESNQEFSLVEII